MLGIGSRRYMLGRQDAVRSRGVIGAHFVKFRKVLKAILNIL